MARDYLAIGCSPAGEECVCVGQEDYMARSRKECQRFINGIRQYMGLEPKYCRLYIKSNPHDFGTYLEVNCEYDEMDKSAIDYAFRCEGELPDTWEELEGGKYDEGSKSPLRDMLDKSEAKGEDLIQGEKE